MLTSKTIIPFFLICLLASVSVCAQVSSYGFSSSSGIYNAIATGTNLGNGALDDQKFVDPAIPNGSAVTTAVTGPGFPIGFNFTVFNTVYDVFGVNANGWIALGNSSSVTVAQSTSPISGAGSSVAIVAFARDLKTSGTTGKLQFSTIGTAPNRTLVVQWSKFRRFGTTANNDTLNFQIRLNETSNTIDVVYDFVSIGTSASTVQVGLRGLTNADFNNRTTTTDWLATTSGTLNSDKCSISNTIFPPSGTTFTWTPPAPCTTPLGGVSTASISQGCVGAAFNLSITGSTLAPGITYQWQSSSDSITWINITGATSLLYSGFLTAKTYYRCKVICNGGAFSNSTAAVISESPPYLCTCTSGATSTVDDDIGNVTFGQINNGLATPATNNSSSINTYTDFSNLPVISSFTQSLTYPLSVTQINSGVFYTCKVFAYIDFNHDGTLDPISEFVMGDTTNSSDNVAMGNVTFPITANSDTGLTKLRIVLVEGIFNIPAPCGPYTYGETEDYLIRILPAPPCINPFIAGNAFSTLTSVCSGEFFELSLDSLPNKSGFTYQWQSSNDSVNWANIPGATTRNFVTTETLETYFRCNIACNAGSLVTSGVVLVSKKPLTDCPYCFESLGGYCESNYIDLVAFGAPVGLPTLNNSNSGCAANIGYAYSQYSPTGSNTVDLGAGNYYDLYVKTTGQNSISVWIDYDQSGSFDANEWKQVTTQSDSGIASTVPIVIPASAKLGLTGMRVRSRKTGQQNIGTDACTNFGSGETEDYFVTIVNVISTGKELAFDKNVKLYPNPTTGILMVEYKMSDSRSLQVRMLNVQGQTVFSENQEQFSGVYNKQLNLASFTKGVYFIQFITEKNVVTRKLILN